MRSAFVLMLFFLCLNLATWVVSTLNVFGLQASPYAEPSAFTSFMSMPTTAYDIITWGFGVIGVIAGILTRNPYVTIAALLVFAIGKLLPFGGWIIAAFPLYLQQLGVHEALTTALSSLFMFVWFFTILEFLSARSVGND